jgi:hypothetical protein
MAVVRVNPNLEAELTGSLFTRGPLERTLGDVADLIVLEAQAIARSEFYQRGGYLRGLQAEHGLDEHGDLVGRVNATDWKSHWGEFGWKSRTGGTRARHILSRAAQRAGFETLGSGLFGGTSGGQRALPAPRQPAIAGRRP